MNASLMIKAISLSLIILFFVSCDKDKDPVDANGGTLDKIIMTGGGDSTVVQFSYDPQGKLISHVSTDYPGAQVGFSDVFTRDNSGRIIKASITEVGYPPMETYITYQPGSSQIKSSVSYYNQQIDDSSAYVYNNGAVTRHIYQYSGSYYYLGRVEYTVQNGNIVNQKFYNVSGGTTTLDWEEQYTYDANAAPYTQTFEESLFTELEYLFNKNNVTKISSFYTFAPSVNETANIGYTYAASGQPLTAHEVWTPSGEIYNYKFLYK